VKIALVSSEAVPYSKTGGLADVAGTLYKEYSDMGRDVGLFVPLYRKTRHLFQNELEDTGFSMDIPLGAATRKCRVLSTGTAFFISNREYFDRDELYGTPNGDFPDNDQRFIFFCRAVLEFCRRTDRSPDIFHCNDWQTGLVPLYLKTLYQDDPAFARTSSLLTIHNLGYQGIFPSGTMDISGLDRKLFSPEGVEFYGKMNFLKAGIIGADAITTVSPTYAEEILTPEQGFGLDGILRKRSGNITGIINGIDYAEWDPAHDPLLPGNYSINDLSGKAACKNKLLKQCALNGGPGTPLLCYIGRLSEQKGIDIMAGALNGLLAGGANVVVLGGGDAKYRSMLDSFGIRYKDSFHFHAGFDNPFAHLCYAGADIFLMPSKYEPCGLGQMIAMRYGTIPVAHATGGLSDTIEDGSSGFLFSEYSSSALMTCAERALAACLDGRTLGKMIKRGMRKDFSWKKPLSRYLKIYTELGRIQR
jgi:starch synthase